MTSLAKFLLSLIPEAVRLTLRELRRMPRPRALVPVDEDEEVIPLRHIDSEIQADASRGPFVPTSPRAIVPPRKR